MVISGGQPVTGWQLHDTERSIWVADVGKLHARHLFVNGTRAVRAATHNIPASLRLVNDGYTLSQAEAEQLGRGDAEFVYTGIYPWSEARIGVEAIQTKDDVALISMKQPAFGWAQKVYKAETPEDKRFPGLNYDGLHKPTRIENCLGLLREPGSFVFDDSARSHHKLYYIPRPGEDMKSVEVIVPMLEQLVTGKGTDNLPLRNVTFRGLTFTHSTWLKPSGPNGFLHYHSATYYEGHGEIEKVEWSKGATVLVPMETEVTPCAMTFEQARSIVLEDNTFTGMGSGALEFTAGCSFNIVQGNIFTDISATPIIIGRSTGDQSLRKDTRQNRFENNWIHHIGQEYAGSSALLVTDTQDLVVAHNLVHDVPHSGINIYGSDVQHGIKANNNHVYNSMLTLADGAGINTASPQGTSAANAGEVRGNVVHDAITSYNFGIYTDYGTAWLTVSDNIIYGSDTPIVIDALPPLQYVTFRHNFWDREPGIPEKPPESVTLADNVLLKGDIQQAIQADSAAREIHAAAGIEHTHPLYAVVKGAER